jgi:hypothetical protein
VQINFLTSVGLKQDEICNMASISVVLLGLNPDTRLKSVTEYLKSRGVSDASVADLVLRHPRIFEYKVRDCGSVIRYLHEGGCLTAAWVTWCCATRASSSTRWVK